MSPTIFKKYVCIIISVKKYKHDIFNEIKQQILFT